MKDSFHINKYGGVHNRFELFPQLHATSKSNPLNLTVNNDLSINTSLEVNYTEKSWTTPGTYTWTVPAGITKVRVAVCGGGGGCIWSNGTGNSGGDSKFSSLLIATGGKGGSAHDEPGYKNDTATGGNGGTPNGNSGIGLTAVTNVTASGGTGFSLSFIKNSGTYGKGGSISCANYGTWTPKAGGGSGCYNTNYLTVTPNKTYEIIVGNGGTSAIGDSDSSQYITSYTNGTSGFVLIAYGKGV